MSEHPEPTPSVAEELLHQADMEFFEALPAAQKERVLREVEFGIKYRGPWPSREFLAQLEAIAPGSTDWIKGEAEKYMAHKLKMQSDQVGSHIRLAERGQWIGAGLAVFFGGIALTAALTGHEVVASVVFGTTIGGLVWIFVLGRRQPPGPPAGSAPKSDGPPGGGS